MMMGESCLIKQMQPPNQPNVIFFVDLTSRPWWSVFTTPFCIDNSTNLLRRVLGFLNQRKHTFLTRTSATTVFLESLLLLFLFSIFFCFFVEPHKNTSINFINKPRWKTTYSDGLGFGRRDSSGIVVMVKNKNNIRMMMMMMMKNMMMLLLMNMMKDMMMTLFHPYLCSYHPVLRTPQPRPSPQVLRHAVAVDHLSFLPMGKACWWVRSR